MEVLILYLYMLSYEIYQMSFLAKNLGMNMIKVIKIEFKHVK